MNQILFMLLMIFSAWLTAELIKFSLDFWVSKRLSLRLFLGYGGFPSAHSALVGSLCASIALVEGFNSAFLVSLILAAIVVRDTVSLRDYIDKNSEHIERLSNNEIRLEKIAHSILEVITGLLIGIVIPIIIYIIFTFLK